MVKWRALSIFFFLLICTVEMSYNVNIYLKHITFLKDFTEHEKLTHYNNVNETFHLKIVFYRERCMLLFI